MRRAGNDAQHLRDRCPMPNNFGQLLLQLRTRGTRRRSALDPRRVFWFGRSCFIFSLPPLGTPGSGPVLRGDGHHNGSSRKSRCLPWGGASQKNGTERPRSAVGQTATSADASPKSALPPKADILRHDSACPKSANSAHRTAYSTLTPARHLCLVF